MNVRLKKNGFYECADALCVVKSAVFPMRRRERGNFKNLYLLGLGGNLGGVRRRFERFYRVLQSDTRFFVAQNSLILKNRPFGFLRQENFLNAVMLVQSSLAPLALLKIMQRAELKFGRKRSFKNAPRTLDVDILYASAKVRPSSRLALPHPGVNERISVILPLGTMKFKRGLICKIKS
ncbi:2-amino-4-hydroxy-6-hydroxymethyldihydropteridine diphosphokinase [uncultured Campylobacter sp.]|uniref:2-amino-4-hydroxy-6- hydroxymethyldihydropteridine diphosphokinase n=1 Tax=uncultured Campylobacter sp. TaxID=218934 RepID=UPI00261E7270|nr:2-amino-4-hydroxy-6-hydroxymethyldihydropteridine diphosphokinase [uncultured Campylobacter sp.]